MSGRTKSGVPGRDRVFRRTLICLNAARTANSAAVPLVRMSRIRADNSGGTALLDDALVNSEAPDRTNVPSYPHRQQPGDPDSDSVCDDLGSQ
jgi:hypothetical protein